MTGDALVYDRRAGQERLRIALNMSGQPQRVDGMGGRVVLSTHLDRAGETVAGAVMLRPDEGLILAP